MQRIALFILFLVVSTFCVAQFTSARFKKLQVTNPVQLDTLTILPSSFKVSTNGRELTTSDYIMNFENNIFRLRNALNDTLFFYYLVFPSNLRRTYQIRDTSILFTGLTSDREKFLITSKEFSVQDAFGGQEIKKRGSVSRGLNFGNNQNLGVNSSLNLELSGKISPNLNLLASVSDANIPIQPQGTTNKLQEFDQLFIQIFNERLKLIAGDFWLKTPHGHFMAYNKRAQGLTFSMSEKLKKGMFKTQQSVALSKGKFHRQIIQGIESNQGPYRLIGAENEPFIVVLAGTEKIFIDGRLLERGQEYDYIIDYNTSELVFTSKNLITKDTRIVAEFQYSDQSYARSLLQSSTEYTTKKVQFWFNAYSEQDAKNQSLQQDLTDNQKIFLSTIGDSINDARISSASNVGYIPNQILYAMVDSLGYDSVYLFSNSPDSAFFRVSFEYVGNNQGNYVFKEQIGLGKIYQWIAPIGGVPQGDYSPTRKLITPRIQQLLSAGAKYTINPSNSISTEYAMSNYNPNLFSQLHRSDNLGFAGKVAFLNTTKLGIDTNGYLLKNNASFEYLSKNFLPIQQFRAVEFDRDWNVRGRNFDNSQLLTQLNSILTHKAHGLAKISGQYYQIGDDFQGSRIYSEGNWKQAKLKTNWDASYLSSSFLEDNQFLRHRLTISRSFGKWKLGYKDDHELNLFQQSDSLRQNSYQFYDFQVFLSTGDSSENNYKLFYRERYDWRKALFSNELKKAAKGTTSGMELNIKQFKSSNLLAIIGWRQLEILDSTLLSDIPENTAVGRLEYQWRTPKGDFSLNSFYEIGSGLEQKKDFIYIKVNDGQGIYTWIDYDNDGIEDLNEFEIAQYVDQANYIRVYTPSSEYAKTFNNECNIGLIWRPERRWRKSTNLLKLIRLFSDQSRFRIQKKISALNWGELLNPFDIALSSTNLITTNSTIKNSLYFNRTSTKFSAEYQIIRNDSKILLASGYDARALQAHELRVNWNVTRFINVSGKVSLEDKVSQVDYTQNRNFNQTIVDGKGEINYQPSTNKRYGLFLRIADKKNIIGTEALVLNEFGFNGKFNQTLKGSLLTDLKFINIRFSGNANSPVGYDMLEALLPGRNIVWNISYQRLLSKNLQLSFSYLGRKGEASRFIHSGGMELRAFF